nr:hypothetical protein CFP56_33796 [Quercus suber]
MTSQAYSQLTDPSTVDVRRSRGLHKRSQAWNGQSGLTVARHLDGDAHAYAPPVQYAVCFTSEVSLPMAEPLLGYTGDLLERVLVLFVVVVDYFPARPRQHAKDVLNLPTRTAVTKFHDSRLREASFRYSDGYAVYHIEKVLRIRSQLRHRAVGCEIIIALHFKWQDVMIKRPANARLEAQRGFDSSYETSAEARAHELRGEWSPGCMRLWRGKVKCSSI